MASAERSQTTQQAALICQARQRRAGTAAAYGSVFALRRNARQKRLFSLPLPGLTP